jgi:hypothetical protein
MLLLAAYEVCVPHYGWAVAATALLFVWWSLSKINRRHQLAAGSLMVNFSRASTHSHQGELNCGWCSTR